MIKNDDRWSSIKQGGSPGNRIHHQILCRWSSCTSTRITDSSGSVNTMSHYKNTQKKRKFKKTAPSEITITWVNI